jgi:hypothetical protein
VYTPSENCRELGNCSTCNEQNQSYLCLKIPVKLHWIVYFFALSHCCRNFISLQLRGCGYDTLPFVIPIKEMTADSGSGFFFLLQLHGLSL